METAHGIIADVRGIFQFLCFHNLNRNCALMRKGERVFEMSPREAGGIGNHGEHLITEHLVRHPGKEGGVHATGVGDEQASAASEGLAQALSFLIECGGSVHGSPLSTKKVLGSQFSVGGELRSLGQPDAVPT